MENWSFINVYGSVLLHIMSLMYPASAADGDVEEANILHIDFISPSGIIIIQERFLP